ncbi:MAG: phytoene/squalene synthase family protein [Chromatiales bacterium]|nr:phytoene/squalene synthase family protein [Chromatiales bacterium]
MDAVVSNSREMIRKGSRSFALASRLFDTATRDHAWMLYAWCRHCDDEIDGQELGMTPATGTITSGMTSGMTSDKVARLAHLRTETLRALAGEPVTEPAFQAFQRVARAHAIPAQHALELLAGFEMDVTDYRYRTFDETLLYCYRVAGVVGVMMARVMGVRDPRVLQRAADLGIGFQLTNISRDVLDDARNGRCYLPAEWLVEAGIPLGGIADPANRQALFGVVERLLQEADRYYQSAAIGLQSLSFRSAWAVATALGVYRDIGRVVRERGVRAWDTRAFVSTPRKALYLCGGGLRALRAVTWDRWRRAAPREQDLWAAPDLDAGDRA